jgi:hypothetical protein
MSLSTRVASHLSVTIWLLTETTVIYATGACLSGAVKVGRALHRRRGCCLDRKYHWKNSVIGAGAVVVQLTVPDNVRRRRGAGR